jgi:hypothetical protein
MSALPIDKEFHRLLCFDWQGNRFAWTRLPFELSCLDYHTRLRFGAPRFVTKIFKPVVARLRCQGIRMRIYLEDTSILHKNKLQFPKHLEITIELL